MAEKKQNNTKFDKKKLDDYSSFIKKYILKLLELDTDLYFFVIPAIVLIIGLLPIPHIYLYFSGIYICISALVLAYKFYKNSEDKILPIIFAGIAVIYNPLFLIGLQIDTVHIALTLGIYVLGRKEFKEQNIN